MFRILVTGSRDWSDPDVLGKALYEVIEASGATEVTIVHGACPSGADKMAAEFCESEAAWFDNMGGCLIEERHPAEWNRHDAGCPDWHRGQRVCRMAGHRRNAEMVALGADTVVAFYKRGAANKGTADCVRRAGAAGIEVRRWSA